MPDTTLTEPMTIAVRSSSRRHGTRDLVFVRAARPAGRGRPERGGPGGRPGAWGDMVVPLRREHPVGARVDRRLLTQPLDQRRAVLVEEVDEPEDALLLRPAGEGLRLCVLELPSQRVVLALGRLDDLGVQLLEVVLHPPLRR